MQPRITVGETPFRFDLATARAAVTNYNRVAGFMQTSLVNQRLTIDQILNPPTGALARGDLDAYVIFATEGWRYLDDQIDERVVSKTLGDYIRPRTRGGRGGDLSDLYVPMREALRDAGVIKYEEPPEMEPVGASGEERPQ